MVAKVLWTLTRVFVFSCLDVLSGFSAFKVVARSLLDDC